MEIIRTWTQLGKDSLKRLLDSFVDFCEFFYFYSKKKIVLFSFYFEKNKNLLVKFFIMKRGRYNRPFLHLTTMTVLGFGVLGAPYIADTYPIFASKASVLDLASAENTEQSIVVGENIFQTNISNKPRDKVVEYTVQKGDTLSTIAKKFQISTDTVRWENDLANDNLAVGDTLRILPVSGLHYKVLKGDTIYSISKKFDTEAQKIANFPFNDFANAENFALVEGQMLVVPDGIKPSEQPFIKRQIYIAQGPVSVSNTGFSWPVQGGVSQPPTWYHMALDITSPLGTAIVSGQSGTVVKVSTGTWDGGYGNNIMIDNGAGYTSLYAHMAAISVGIGDKVTAGKSVLGTIGVTGRSTGPHVHFEIRQNGVLVNPLSFLN